MIKSVVAHLHFDGRSDEAIALYQHALGAKVEACMRWSQRPGGAPSDEDANLVMHARLGIGQGAALLLADVPKSAPCPGRPNGTLLLEFDHVAELTACFDKLADGGRVVMGVHAAFWGATFAMVDDRLGVSWMLICENGPGSGHAAPA